MDRQSVASSNIVSVGYDEGSETLEVEFAGGQVYQYYNVGAALYEQFKSASSKGQFLNAHIRNSYPYSRV
ncbi:MAG: KTSC domain-containing protein [Phycisphaerales bacterium]|nr:KTSC domain-containing protein [Hyphomonadaceae bacterium]